MPPFRESPTWRGSKVGGNVRGEEDEQQEEVVEYRKEGQCKDKCHHPELSSHRYKRYHEPIFLAAYIIEWVVSFVWEVPLPPLKGKSLFSEVPSFLD